MHTSEISSNNGKNGVISVNQPQRCLEKLLQMVHHLQTRFQTPERAIVIFFFVIVSAG